MQANTNGKFLLPTERSLLSTRSTSWRRRTTWCRATERTCSSASCVALGSKRTTWTKWSDYLVFVPCVVHSLCEFVLYTKPLSLRSLVSQRISFVTQQLKNCLQFSGKEYIELNEAVPKLGAPQTDDGDDVDHVTSHNDRQPQDSDEKPVRACVYDYMYPCVDRSAKKVCLSRFHKPTG